MRLREDEFARVLAATGMDPSGKTAAAAKLVLVEGKSLTTASQMAEVSLSVVSRGVKRLESVEPQHTICPKCGHQF